MATVLAKVFGNKMPANASKDLEAQINIFLGYFKQDLAEQNSTTLTYVPFRAAGTILKQHGKQHKEHARKSPCGRLMELLLRP